MLRITCTAQSCATWSERLEGAPGTPINYGTCCWDLGPDEALYIESDLPDGLHWSFQLVNAGWEAPDQQNARPALVNPTHTSIRTDASGRDSTSRSRRADWLDSGEARRGFLWYRWFQPKDKQPVPTCRVVKFEELRRCFPDEHPRLDAAKRKAQLAVPSRAHGAALPALKLKASRSHAR